MDPRSYSPVPPPCPSPELYPQPLPTPRRPSLTPSTSSSREHLPPRLRIKPSAAASAESLVFSLKDAMVAGSPSSRRFSEHTPLMQQASISDSTLDRRRPHTADVDRSFVSLPSPLPTSPSYKRKHRQSDSINRTADLPFPLPSRSLSRKRTRSPTGRPLTADTEAPPPVPPLPPLPPKREGYARALLGKKLPPIRIPELGLGLDEKLRTPLSPSKSSSSSANANSHFRRYRIGSAAAKPAESFLHMSPPKTKKRPAARASLTGCISVRSSHSLPDIKDAKRRSTQCFTDRLFRLGTGTSAQHVVH